MIIYLIEALIIILIHFVTAKYVCEATRGLKLSKVVKFATGFIWDVIGGFLST